MMKKISVLMVMLLSASCIFATDGLWYRESTLYTLLIDLSQTLSIPVKGWNKNNPNTTPPAGYYNNTTFLSKVGVTNVSSPVTVTVSCNNTVVDANNMTRYAMYSASNNRNAYRTFSIYACYRANNDKNYNPNTGAVGGDPTYILFGDGSGNTTPMILPVSTGTSYWIDFVLVMDSIDNDAAHMVSANDYQAVVTISCTSNADSGNGLFSLPLQGYYNYEKPSSEGDCFFSITDDQVVLDINSMKTNEETKIGSISFHTRSFDNTSDGSINYTQKMFTIGMGALSAVTGNDFELKKIDDEGNELPIRIRVIPTTRKLKDNSAYILDSGETSVATPVLEVNVNRDIQYPKDRGWAVSYDYEGSIMVSLRSDYDATAFKELSTGEYYCYIYFSVTSP